MAELTALEHDFDVMAADYVADPYPVWDEMRTTCPVAHTDRHGGAWITTTYEDVTRVARDPGVFSSRDVSVIPAPDSTEGDLLPVGLPPIQSDPPVHTWSRRLVLPWFSHEREPTHGVVLDPLHDQRPRRRTAGGQRAAAPRRLQGLVPALSTSRVGPRAVTG